MRTYILIAFILLCVLSLSVGCAMKDFHPGEISDQDLQSYMPVETSSSTIEKGNADVQFRILLPDDATTSVPPSAMIRAASSGATTVTFGLKIINLADSKTPVTQVVKTVPVVNGTAETYFSGVPTRTVIGFFHIEGGKKDNYTDYRGAGDLTPGSNTVDLSPLESMLKPDMVANLLERLVASQTVQARLFQKLAAEAGNVVDYIRQSSQISYDKAFETFLAQLPTTIGTMKISANVVAPDNAVFSTYPSTSIRAVPNCAIFAASRAKPRYVARVTTNPGGSNEVSTTTSELQVSDDKKILTIDNVSVDAPVGKSTVSIEILPASFTTQTAPVFKGYDVQTANVGQDTASAPILEITPASTAQALAFDQWKIKSDAFNQTIENFLENKPDVSSLTDRIKNQLSTVLTADAVPDNTFQWNTQVTAQAKDIASNTPVIPRKGRIVGDLTDESTGAPIAGALIGIAGTTIFAVTDENGHFEITDLAPGIYDLVIQRDGYAPRTQGGVQVDADPVTSIRGIQKNILWKK